MADRLVYVAGLGPYIIDDEVDIGDVNFPGQTYAAINTNGRVVSTATPVSDNDMVRQGDLIDSFDLDVDTFASNVTLTVNNEHVRMDATGGARVVTLPAASLALLGEAFSIKKVDSSRNSVTVQPASGQTLDGRSSLALTRQYDRVAVVCNGTSWDIIDKRTALEKVTAASVDLQAGTTVSGVVADLQSRGGNNYHIDEAAGSPAINLEVVFTGVAVFDLVRVGAAYNGSATHYVNISLYNYVDTQWEAFNVMVSTSLAVFEDYSFVVPDCSKYVSSSGEAKVRFYHPTSGSASHDLYIDEVSLYRN